MLGITSWVKLSFLFSLLLCLYSFLTLLDVELILCVKPYQIMVI